MTHPTLLEDVWREQSVWSRTSNRMKKKIENARLQALVLVVLVAIFGTTAAAIHEQADALSKVLAAAAALGSAVLPLLRPRWSATALKDWTRARSVSEALKADVYLWLAKARPFENDPAAQELRARTERLRRDAADLLPKRQGITAEQRGLPPVHDLQSFFTERVERQRVEYYEKKAKAIAGRITQFRWLEIGLSLIGAGLGVTAVLTGPSLAGWITVVVTVGTAMSVHVSATRYEFQLIEFSRTAEELRQIGERADVAGVTDDELRRLAVRAERVISVENQAWMAKLAEDPPEQNAQASVVE